MGILTDFIDDLFDATDRIADRVGGWFDGEDER